MKKRSKSQLIKILDQKWSKYIRNKYAQDGYVQCVTCRVKKTVATMQNGHYIKRSVKSLRWSEENCFPQCVACNVFKNGNYPEFALYLIGRFGEGHLRYLEEQSKVIKKWSIVELESLIASLT